MFQFQPHVFLLLREYIPLEQGLRHLCHKSKVLKVKLREYIPLEQGLRQGNTLCIYQLTELREYIPLEQGLRHIEVLDKLLECHSESIFH